VKVFIFPGFDLDNFREANPHLRVDLIDAESATPFCLVKARGRQCTGYQGRKSMAGECNACDATYAGKTRAIRLGWQIAGRITLCPRCAK